MRVRDNSGKLGTILEIDAVGPLVRWDNGLFSLVDWCDVEIIA